MGTYIGVVEYKNYFYNFKPIAEIKDGSIQVLTSYEQEDLLPESDKRNINLSYNNRNEYEENTMKDICKDKELLVFQFSQSDLEDNYDRGGDRNPTGYRVQAVELIESGRIKPLCKSGVYYVIKKSDLLPNSNFRIDASVEIDERSMPYLQEKDRVFIDDIDFWAGPYEVYYNNVRGVYYIRPRISENKYIVSGYKKDAVQLIELESNSGWTGANLSWSVIMPAKDTPVEQKDLISTEQLIASFQDSLSHSVVEKGVISLDNIPSIIHDYDTSVLSGANLNAAIRQERLDRLKTILTDEKDIDNTLSQITASFCDLLIKYQDQENVESWLESLIRKHPELMDQIKDARSIQDRIQRDRQELDELQNRKDSLKQEIEQKQDEANRIDQEAIKEKRDELLNSEKRYGELKEKIQENLQLLKISADAVELQKKVDDLNKEIGYKEWRNEELNAKNNDLETAGKKLQDSFKSYIESAKDGMMNIAFDGFRSSKMLRAAAEWEQQESDKQTAKIFETINGVKLVDKTPEELVIYLCNTIRAERPSYTRNTILNIAICFTQGFLTVFSGEPGCGKTSICNIFGRVLGLNHVAKMLDACEVDNTDKLNRFISVSVERGWSSKRDFVGYYNPLSKQYDKSNRKLYDALYLLSEEKRQHNARLPFLILLDEANLSPMEYYWSDFMNVCDDLDEQSEINLGENFVLGIPETLHFFATINNDQTTEILSPRLIDRAWIITLPSQTGKNWLQGKKSASQVETVSWASLKNAFLPADDNYLNEWAESVASKVYDLILQILKEQRIVISPRVELSIRKYWGVASKYFQEDETKTEPQLVALDYAIAQRILPKLAGSGQDYRTWLETLKNSCSSNGLNMSKRILEDMLDRGDRQMKYYNFFY